jgi:FAD/FMN-containing dehydrogenase
MVDRWPALIACCTGVADVVAALRFARERHLEISVRGGGHGVGGHAVTAGGVMIDLSPMRGIRVDPERRHAWVQAGCLWSEVDRETYRVGLATTGGVVSHTGVAGLTLGGGQGWLARHDGLSCDNLISADLVTADGELVVAAEDRHAPLFWGLRGGGGNFGIVTSFQFRLRPVPPLVLAAHFFYSPDAGLDALRAFRELAAEAPDEMTYRASAFTAEPAPFLPARWHGQPLVLVSAIYVGHPEDGLQIAAPLRRVARPLAELVQPMPYSQLQSAGDESQQHGLRRYWKSSYMSGLTDAALDAFLRRGSEPGAGRSASGSLLLLGGAISRVGENDTAYGHRDAAFDFMATADWTDPSQDGQQMAAARQYSESMAPFSAKGVYVNNLGLEGEGRVRAAYGPLKYARLQALKDRYDPDNVFHLNQNIRPSTGNRPDLAPDAERFQ